MTGYKLELWSELVDGTPFHVVRVTDPYGELIGEVRSLTEEMSLRLAHELKKADGPRFKVNHGIVG